jgi:hypothetical protein
MTMPFGKWMSSATNRAAPSAVTRAMIPGGGNWPTRRLACQPVEVEVAAPVVDDDLVPVVPRDSGQVNYSLIQAMSAVPGHGAIWAVGDEITGHHPYLSWVNERSLILRWNGRSWRTILLPEPPKADPHYTLAAIAGQSCADAWFVGSDYVPPPPGGIQGFSLPIAIHC